jgi:hypothetical protein
LHGNKAYVSRHIYIPDAGLHSQEYQLLQNILIL